LRVDRLSVSWLGATETHESQFGMSFPVDEEFILAAEQELGRFLPQALRARLRRANGGEIDAKEDVWTLYPVRDTSDYRRLARTSNDIVRETEQARRWRGFPEDATAIAENGSGDLLVLRAGSDEVELWQHETAQCELVVVDWT
jgi:hypothetical protein